MYTGDMVRRIQTAVFAALAAIATVSVAPVANAESTQHAEERIAVVRIQIVEADGRVVSKTKAIRWGTQARFEVTSDGHTHVVELQANAEGASSRVEFGYARDGVSVAKNQRRAVNLRRATKLFSDSDASVRVMITPTKVRVATH